MLLVINYLNARIFSGPKIFFVSLLFVVIFNLYLCTVADKKVSVSVAFNRVSFPFRWHSVSIWLFPVAERQARIQLKQLAILFDAIQLNTYIIR